MTNEDLDQFLRHALRQQAYQAPPARPDDAARLLQLAQGQQIAGRWEGYGRQKLPKDTLLTLPPELGKHILVPRDMTFVVAVRLTLESAGNSQLSGDGELDFDFRPLGIEFVKTAYVDINGAVLKGGRFTIELQNIEDNGHLAHISGRLSEDGSALSGTYQALGLTTKKGVTGEFYLEKVREPPGDYEVIIFEGRRKVLDLLRQARRSVLVTHFTTEIPNEEYVSLMLEKLRDEVPITRIVAFLPDTPKEVYSWLKRFRKRDGTARRYYKEYQFSGTPLPSDIMVVDDEVALQYFATYPDPSIFSFAICHYDPRVARRFREYIEALIPNQKLPSPTTFMHELTKHFYQ